MNAAIKLIILLLLYSSHGKSAPNDLLHASRIVLEDIEVSEDIEKVTVELVRIGNLTVDSEAILRSRPTTPVEADNNDYVEFPSKRIFYDGDVEEETVSFSITIIDDNIAERSHESFEIQAIALKNIYFPLPVVRVTIIDNDEAAVVEFVTPEYTISEGEGEVKVCLRLEGQIASEAIVRLVPLPDTAKAGQDYMPGRLNFVIFQPSGDSVVECNVIEVIDDDLALENDEERFMVGLSVVDGPIDIGTQSQTTITIQENDVLVVELMRKEFTVSEEDCQIKICLRKNMETAEMFSINVTITEFQEGNSATAGTDFIATNTTVVFLPSQTEACFSLDIIDDVIPNEPDETIFVHFTESIMYVILPSVKITIIDNDMKLHTQ